MIPQCMYVLQLHVAKGSCASNHHTQLEDLKESAQDPELKPINCNGNCDSSLLAKHECRPNARGGMGKSPQPHTSEKSSKKCGRYHNKWGVNLK